MANPADNWIQAGPPTARYFFCLVRENTEGPFDLIELAGQLRTSHIGPDTMVRREGKEKWLALRELPEFTSIQEMPIETIARHLVEKENSSNPASRAEAGNFFSNAMPLVICLAVGAGILMIVALSQKSLAPGAPPPSPGTPAQELWATTEDDSFSVECPIPMERIDSSDTAQTVCSYRASFGVVNFVVEIYALPDAVPKSEYYFLIDSARNKLVKGLKGNITSQQFFSRNDCQGLDTSFSEGTQLNGELRVLAGRGKLAVVSVVAASGSFKSSDMDRFLNSFILR